MIRKNYPVVLFLILFSFLGNRVNGQNKTDTTTNDKMFFSVHLFTYTTENVKDSLARWETLKLDPIYIIQISKEGHKMCMMGKYSNSDLAIKKCSDLRKNGFPQSRVRAFKNGKLIKDDDYPLILIK